MPSAAESEAALALVSDYAKKRAAEEPEAADHLARYAATSAQFASIGGAVGTAIPIPGVGTAMGALVGAGAGILYEGGKDLIDAVFEDGPKRVNEAPEKAERAFHAYQALGGEKGTKMPYEQWWKTYVAAGRPSLEVLKATRAAERAARKAAKGAGVAPPPPPPPKRSRDAGAFATSQSVSSASLPLPGFDSRESEARGAATGFLVAVPLLAAFLWFKRR